MSCREFEQFCHSSCAKFEQFVRAQSLSSFVIRRAASLSSFDSYEFTVPTRRAASLSCYPTGLELEVGLGAMRWLKVSHG